jgi:hypothetical protein
VFLGIAGALWGCSGLLGIDSDRTLVVDAGIPETAAPEAAPEAGADRVMPSGPWGCLQLPAETLDPSLKVTVTLQVFDALQTATALGSVDGGSDLTTVSAAWLSGVSVRSCSLLDPTCGQGSAPVVTDDAGQATFHLTGDFSGYFELTRSDLVPWSLYPQNLLAGQTSTDLPAFGLSPAGFQFIARAITSTPLSLDTDGGLGHAFVQIFDCQDHQASGVQLTYSGLGAETVIFYMKNGVPSTSATRTDSFGIGGVLNVPTGSLTVSGSLAAGLQSIGTADVVIRPGTVTLAFIRVRSH